MQKIIRGMDQPAEAIQSNFDAIKSFTNNSNSVKLTGNQITGFVSGDIQFFRIGHLVTVVLNTTVTHMDVNWALSQIPVGYRPVAGTENMPFTEVGGKKVAISASSLVSLGSYDGALWNGSFTYITNDASLS